jgi:hypothetical protein
VEILWLYFGYRFCGRFVVKIMVSEGMRWFFHLYTTTMADELWIMNAAHKQPLVLLIQRAI